MRASERRRGVVLADRVERRERRAQLGEAAVAPAAEVRCRRSDRIDRRTRPVVGEAERRVDDAADRRARPHRLGDRGGEHARRLSPVARLVPAGEVDRLRVGAVRVAGVRDADRRDVHRRAAVDDVAHTRIARIGVAVAQLEHKPLLRQEEPVVEQVLAVELRNPHLLVDQLRHQSRLDVERVEVVALRVVDVDERARHQRVVGDVTVALVEGRERLLDSLRHPDRRHDPFNRRAEVIGDLARLPPLGRTADSVADCRTRQGGDCTIVELVLLHTTSSSKYALPPPPGQEATAARLTRLVLSARSPSSNPTTMWRRAGRGSTCSGSTPAEPASRPGS